jgi:RelE toxin of RelE / RelB toxin-antitoxin system
MVIVPGCPSKACSRLSIPSHRQENHRKVAPGATIKFVAKPAAEAVPTFKTAWFAKAARKAHITDDELCFAIQRVSLGQVDELGGGVFKKRLRKNQYRSIILARAGHF